MRLEEERHGPVVVLVPVGDVDLNLLPAFAARLDALVAAGVRAVLWDVAGSTLLPSAAIGFLLEAARRLERAGGAMALAGASRRVRSTLRTMGLEGVIRVHETRARGIADLASRAGAP